VRQKADALLAELRKDPKRFAELAKANSQDPGSAERGGDLDFFGRGAMVKPFEDAVYSLKKGQISDVVESDFGFHIIQLTDIKSPPKRSFDEVRAQLEADLKKQQAQRQFAEAADVFSNTVYEQADSLQAAADRLKLKVQTAQGVQRQGLPGTVLANERLLAAIFSPESINSKRNTEAVETGASQLTAARVVKHSPAHTLALAEVRETVRAKLIAQRATELAKAEGEKQLQAGKSGGEVAGLGPALTLSRATPQNQLAGVLNAALSADPKQLPAWIGVNLPERGYAVVKVEKVLPAEPRPAAQVAREVQQYNQWWASAEGQAYYEVLKARHKAVIKVAKPAASSAAEVR